MTTAKIDVKIGSLAFAGEGDKEWLAKQLDKLIEHAPSLLQLTPQSEDRDVERDNKPPRSGNVGTLAAFLSAKKDAKSSQPQKFLATATWLHDKGNKTLTTADINKALEDNHQGKLPNASDSMAKNVRKGYCERSGRNFYVTEEGRKALG